ncbi:MAG TPA: chorismate-binding protein, partial [Thermoanaerobaculia bacterium]|nr:chorismate-binding protein [Thermoanaerobaculia bacterium]
MWSDRLSEKRRRQLANRLMSAVPAPAEGSRGSRTPLRTRITPSPEAVAEALRGEGLVWLDGGSGPHRLFTRPLATLTVRNGRAKIGEVSFKAGGFDLLEAAFAAWGGTAGAALVGYFGYELAGELEPLPPPLPDDLGLPDLHLQLFSSGLLWDGRGWSLEATNAWSAVSVVDFEQLLEKAGRHAVQPLSSGRLAAGPVVSRPGQSGFMAAVERIRERIASGEIFQANLCRRLEAPLPEEAVWPFYRRLRAASPADHGAFFDLGEGRALLSVSPELYLSVRGD